MTVSGWTFVFVGLSFGLYLLIAWLSRVRDTQGFYVAGRGFRRRPTAWPPRPIG